MKKLFVAILLLSLLANLWLGRTSFRAADHGPASAPASAAAVTVKPPAPANSKATAEAAEEARIIGVLVAHRAAVEKALADGDIATLGETLKQAGVDTVTIRAVVDGTLWRRYQQKQAFARKDRQDYGWWRGGVVPANARSGPSTWADVNQPLRAAFGRNPIDQAEAELRYSFLPPEKRKQLANIEIDYHEMRSNGSVSRAQVEESRLLAQERERDIFNALTPEERAEYELRFGGGNRVASRFAAMDATETEARAIKPLVLALEERLKTLPANDPASASAQAQMEQAMLDQLVAKVGYDRAVDFWWASTSGAYVPTLLQMRELNLPSGNAAQLFQLGAETSLKAAAIHHDAALTVPQKQSALAALQTAARSQLDALVPPDAQAKLPTAALAWYNDLAAGRYTVPNVSPVTSSTGAGQAGFILSSVPITGAVSVAQLRAASTGPQNVTAPPRGTIPTLALPRKIGN